MNKEELEKIINHFLSCWFNDDELKDYIFNEIIPEVLKSILIKKEMTNRFSDEKKIYFNRVLKQKAKEQFWIEL